MMMVVVELVALATQFWASAEEAKADDIEMFI